MMLQGDVVNQLVGTPYARRDQKHRPPDHMDCWEVVVRACELAGFPRPPLYDVVAATTRAKIVRAMKKYRDDWQRVDTPFNGAVVLLGGEVPYHAGLGIADGILHADEKAGVEFVPLDYMRFRSGEWYAWRI